VELHPDQEREQIYLLRLKLFEDPELSVLRGRMVEEFPSRLPTVRRR
jgi:hypothetical protein